MCTKHDKKAEEFLDLRQLVKLGQEYLKVFKKTLGVMLSRW